MDVAVELRLRKRDARAVQHHQGAVAERAVGEGDVAATAATHHHPPCMHGAVELVLLHPNRKCRPRGNEGEPHAWHCVTRLRTKTTYIEKGSQRNGLVQSYRPKSGKW